MKLPLNNSIYNNRYQSYLSLVRARMYASLVVAQSLCTYSYGPWSNAGLLRFFVGCHPEGNKKAVHAHVLSLHVHVCVCGIF